MRSTPHYFWLRSVWPRRTRGGTVDEPGDRLVRASAVACLERVQSWSTLRTTAPWRRTVRHARQVIGFTALLLVSCTAGSRGPATVTPGVTGGAAPAGAAVANTALVPAPVARQEVRYGYNPILAGGAMYVTQD